mmetsp:Transcript_7047/g.13291  ORF Transcript_7047/g.13291 Transcript_7047/m.13291 type:complete len:260 (-) Transcript_7047:306-1085(-)
MILTNVTTRTATAIKTVLLVIIIVIIIINTTVFLNRQVTIIRFDCFHKTLHHTPYLDFRQYLTILDCIQNKNGIFRPWSIYPCDTIDPNTYFKRYFRRSQCFKNHIAWIQQFPGQTYGNTGTGSPLELSICTLIRHPIFTGSSSRLLSWHDGTRNFRIHVFMLTLSCTYSSIYQIPTFEIRPIPLGSSREGSDVKHGRTMGRVRDGHSIVITYAVFHYSDDSIIELWNVSLGICNNEECIGRWIVVKSTGHCGNYCVRF